MTRLPLEHIRVVDLTQAWAGSYALQLIADLGAEVIKVESRSRPDPWRGGFEAGRGLAAYPKDGPGERPYNRAYLANSVNRNKQGITLDLSTAEGRDLFLDLVRTADVVAENFTPRVLGNLGLDYETLSTVRPEVILLSMPAFGLAGPYHDYPGIGGTIEPMSGNAWLLGERKGHAQVSGVMYPDAVAGLNGASAILTAIFHRERTGKGLHMEVSQHESMIAMLGEFFATGVNDLGRIANRDLEFVPNGIYPCRGEDAWIAISIRDDVDWQRLTECVDVEALKASDLAHAEGRRAAEDLVDKVISGWTCQYDASALEEKLLEANIPAACVRSMDEVLTCPQLSASNYFIAVEQPEGIGAMPMAGIIAKLSDSPGSVRLPPTEHGVHSRNVLQRVLGLDDPTLDRLEEAGVIGAGPPPDTAAPNVQ
jgi:crotonobetainyl-CoA:carnitine CoA-transferase CaiB-like acyl-CoA transferase